MSLSAAAQWRAGDRVQVRDKRDGALAIAHAVVTKVEGRVVYVQEDGTGYACGVLGTCIEKENLK